MAEPKNGSKWRWVWSIVLAACVATIAWAHGVLWSHEARIVSNENHRTAAEEIRRDVLYEIRDLRSEVREIKRFLMENRK